jgi:hypothetical protein
MFCAYTIAIVEMPYTWIYAAIINTHSHDGGPQVLGIVVF